MRPRPHRARRKLWPEGRVRRPVNHRLGRVGRARRRPPEGRRAVPAPGRGRAAGRAHPGTTHGRVVAGTPRLGCRRRLDRDALRSRHRPYPTRSGLPQHHRPRRFTVTTEPAETASADSRVALCRCLASDAVEGRHRPGCLIAQTIARVNRKLQAESGQDPWSIADLVESGAEWGHDAVLPNGAVLLLVASPPPVLPSGLWQRQDTLLVAVTKESYADEVEQCGTFQ